MLIKCFIIYYNCIYMDMTMVQLRKVTVERLKKLKKYSRQTYDELVNTLIDNPDELSAADIDEIKKGIAEIRAGNVSSEKEVAEKLRISV